MESDRFDRLVQRAHEAASRRGVVRAGIGALAASAFVTLGLTEDAEGRRQKKKGRKRRLVCFKGETLVVRRRKRFFKQGATKGACPETPPETCPANLPITCGEGCCPTEFPKCCTARLGENQNIRASTASSSTCNPQDFNCCPAEQGGGSCAGEFPLCCPPTKDEPFGTCERADRVCCPVAQGGGACDPDYPVCCPGDPQDMYGEGRCCAEGESCCDAEGNCPSGFICDGGPGGCCVAENGVNPEAKSRKSGSARFHMAAQ